MKPLLLALLAAGSLLASCSASGGVEPDPVWRQARVEAPSDNVLWKVALLSLEQSDFPLIGGMDPSSGIVMSGWKTQLQPFHGEGDRQRAEIRMEPVAERLWMVKARVQRQRNMALASPLDATRAEWKWDAENPVAAEILLRHIVSLFDSDPIARDDETRTPAR